MEFNIISLLLGDSDEDWQMPATNTHKYSAEHDLTIPEWHIVAAGTRPGAATAARVGISVLQVRWGRQCRSVTGLWCPIYDRSQLHDSISCKSSLLCLIC